MEIWYTVIIHVCRPTNGMNDQSTNATSSPSIARMPHWVGVGGGGSHTLCCGPRAQRRVWPSTQRSIITCWLNFSRNVYIFNLFYHSMFWDLKSNDPSESAFSPCILYCPIFFFLIRFSKNDEIRLRNQESWIFGSALPPGMDVREACPRASSLFYACV